MSVEPYVKIRVDGKQVREHRYKASQALGRPLKSNEHVHHIDYNTKNNRNSNLLVCDNDYHRLIHARTDAYNACGNADYKKCVYCGKYDDPINMYNRPKQYQGWHKECRQDQRRVENPKTGPYKYGVKK